VAAYFFQVTSALLQEKLRPGLRSRNDMWALMEKQFRAQEAHIITAPPGCWIVAPFFLPRRLQRARCLSRSL
jgi:hypothetical protein